MQTTVTFDTKAFFSGGAGMFLEYHDIIKPVKLYAILCMILNGESYGLPIRLIQHSINLSITEWYMKRRYKNPLQQLDYLQKAMPGQLDDLLQSILRSDASLYRFAPVLNQGKLFTAYQRQHMNFPVYVYSEQEEPHILCDCKQLFPRIPIQYVYGDLKTCLQKCDENFTYIFSDIELMKSSIEILHGTCSHVLLAGDYRYNYRDNQRTLKYDLMQLSKAHPFIRTGLIQAVDWIQMAHAIKSMFD